jgi:hypothetical protein
LKVYMNWKTRVTHITRDCHQIVAVPEGTPWLETQEEENVEDLVNVARRYCGFCVSRLLMAAVPAGVEPIPEFRTVPMKSDVYVRDAARGGEHVRKHRAIEPIEGTEVRVTRDPDRPFSERLAGSDGTTVDVTYKGAGLHP